MSLELCARIKQRVAFDKRKGMTTSSGTLDFLRRSCTCVPCSDARAQLKRWPGGAPKAEAAPTP